MLRSLTELRWALVTVKPCSWNDTSTRQIWNGWESGCAELFMALNTDCLTALAEHTEKAWTGTMHILTSWTLINKLKINKTWHEVKGYKCPWERFGEFAVFFVFLNTNPGGGDSTLLQKHWSSWKPGFIPVTAHVNWHPNKHLAFAPLRVEPNRFSLGLM